MRSGVLVAALVAGCGFSGANSTPRDGSTSDGKKLDGPMVDAKGDAPTDVTESGTCYGTGLVRVCVAAPPTMDLVTGNALDIDTDGSSLCATTTAGTSVAMCAVVRTNIQLSGGVSGHGSKPLVFVSTTAIGLSAPVDVASHVAGQLGAGHGTDSSCNVGTAPTDASGGGAGGSFGTTGGKGGNGTGGAAGAIVAGAGFRGGCRGQAGGNAALAGQGGGALALIAVVNIGINATINASGAAGGGASQDEGGGGAGAGGMIVLDAPTVTMAAGGKLIANGGGGGEGGGNGAGQNGNPGQESIDLGAAPGGTAGSPTGGDGGNGATGASVGANGNSGAGGGGAGGGEGIIHVFPPSQAPTTNISPPAT